MVFFKRIGVAILGGGKGERFGGVTPKPLVNVLGHPLVYYSLKLFSSMANVSSIVITFPKEFVQLLEKSLEPYGMDIRRKVVEGGETRAHSCLNALEAIKQSKVDIVLIHDAVRPCISSDEVEQLIFALEKNDGAFLGAPSTDTLWKVDNETAIQTVERERTVRAFTPQAFHFQTIYDAIKRGIEDKFFGSDDASYVVRYGGKVGVVYSSQANIKVTYPKDIEIVEAILSGGQCA